MGGCQKTHNVIRRRRPSNVISLPGHIENEREVLLRRPLLRRQISKSSDELNSVEAVRRRSVPAKLETSSSALARAPSLDTAIDEEPEENSGSDLSAASSLRSKMERWNSGISVALKQLPSINRFILNLSFRVVQYQNPAAQFDAFRGLCHVQRRGKSQDEQSEGMEPRQVEGGRQPVAQELRLELRGQEEGERPGLSPADGKLREGNVRRVGRG